ncbi:unnamed protein product [Symbiodinium sp. CCMP2456]|nr:unnamed protein product [Symbiodinium sp. CCMP2456]
MSGLTQLRAGVEDGIECCRVHRTFVEGVVLTPCPPRSRSWPDFSQSVVELLHTEPEMIQKSEKRATHEHVQPAWDDCLGLSPGHHLWAGVTNLMICNLPARCTQQELEAFLTDLVPGTMKLTLPLSASGRNRGYAFVRAAEITVQQLVSVLWRKCVPTRKSTRPLKLQPANMHKMKVSQ